MSDLEESRSKRKRDEETKDELEIDLSLPEPLSKKDQRKVKKAKLNSKEGRTNKSEEAADGDHDTQEKSAETLGLSSDKDPKSKGTSTEERRSEWGIWIGNLPWMIGKSELREFFCVSESISDDNITRIHLPAPSSKDASKMRDKPKNRGFAYVDFDTQETQQAALLLTERNLRGRNVLIKQANNFEGRPVAPPEPASETFDKDKPPSKKIFVGNLGFEVTQEDVTKHFSQCGHVEHVFLATFEDSGKCKGFGWITFADVESAKSAVRGWMNVTDETADEEDETTTSKKPKTRKKKVSILQGRYLRCEFAEDQQVRFRKRHGKDRSTQGNSGIENIPDISEESKLSNHSKPSSSHEQRRDARKAAKYREIEKRMQSTQTTFSAKATGAIVAPTGKTIVFD